MSKSFQLNFNLKVGSSTERAVARAPVTDADSRCAKKE